jgi:DNA-directed RNA polymerase specialized sigma24 family protein
MINKPTNTAPKMRGQEPERNVWRLYLIDNKSLSEISKLLNITKSKLKNTYGIK